MLDAHKHFFENDRGFKTVNKEKYHFRLSKFTVVPAKSRFQLTTRLYAKIWVLLSS